MSEKMIILDPASLNIMHNGTKKKREKAAKIKINPVKKKEKKTKVSTLKRNLLNMIRTNQESRLKNEPKHHTEDLLTPPKSDFEESVQFFNKLPKEEEEVPSNHNKTLKSYIPKIDIPSYLPHNTAVPPHTAAPYTAAPHTAAPNPPPWGNLKQGLKPTYRVWRNTTEKNSRPPTIRQTVIDTPLSPFQKNYESSLNEKIKEMSEREQYASAKKIKQDGQLRFLKKKKPKHQKRTVRRTYRIGKYKVNPLVSLLVSNKTLRNEANLRKLALKETPMPEVKQYLRKHGFLKIGTATPNDVIRQMYENVKLVCGEVHNHNPDNLLYNYFNEKND
jgi:hypothetical protein